MADDDEDLDVEEILRASPDASDGRQVRQRQQALMRQQRQDADVIRKLMLSPAGRAWMWRKLEATRAFMPNYVPGNESPSALNDLVYYEGQRRFGLDLLAEVMLASTDLYLTMFREAQAAKQAEN